MNNVDLWWPIVEKHLDKIEGKRKKKRKQR